MNRTIAATLLVLAIFLFSSVAIQPVHSMSSGTIFIKPNGSIDPSTAPIHHSGEIYTFTGNINSQIVLETDNIILDGSGYALQGGGSGVAINMTCSNVTVQNIDMINWKAGVLGVFNNNTIKNCLITQCESAFKIYAQYYAVIGNDIVKNNEGIRIGQGGLNFIAGNNITNNGVGFYLFDSGNEIVQNNIANCSQSAITLDATAWSQTVYHNNFVNNQKELIDYTYSNIGRPAQSSLPPWDNGSSGGNYWSDYTGTDINGDGIGDTPCMVTTYFAFNETAPYSFVDRYPLIAPFNINTAILQIPTTLTPTTTPQPVSSANDQAIALSFLKNVIQLDVSKYTVTLTYDTVRTSNAEFSADYLGYGLIHMSYGSERTANASFSISNNAVTSFSLEPTGGQLFFTNKISNNFDAASRIMQNYQIWKNDSDVNKMINLLNMAGSERNITELSDNIDLKILTTPEFTSFSWSYTYNGANYSSVNLELQNIFGSPFIIFSDNRGIYSIGNTNINISKQQAINIAENYVRNYSYPLDFGNGTIIIVKDLNVNETNTTANLSTTSRDPLTLYPYWSVQVPLDRIYPGETYAVTVNVWADNGAVFNAQRDVVPLSFPVPSLAPVSLLAFVPTLVITASIIAITVVILAVVVIVLYLKDKQKTTKF